MSEISPAEIDVAPNPAMVDEPVAIRVRGLAPQAQVRLCARMLDDAQHEWQSEAMFLADARGEIDVRRAAALSGSYQGVDGMGLFWSMSLIPNTGSGRVSP